MQLLTTKPVLMELDDTFASHAAYPAGGEVKAHHLEIG